MTARNSRVVKTKRPRETDAELEDRIAREMHQLAHEDGSLDYTANWSDEAQIMKMPAPEWLVEGWLPAKGVAVLYGAPGIGKTLQLIAWAKHVQRGEPWCGRKVKQGPVLFFEGETLEGFGPRIRAFNDAVELPDGATEAAIRYVGTQTDISSAASIVAVIKAGRELRRKAREPLAMVVIEPLIENMSGDENAAGMEEASRALRVIAKELGCLVGVGHHSNASGERERGNQKLRARVHTMLRMEYINGDTVGLVAEKQRNGELRAMQLGLTPRAQSVVLLPLVEQSVQEYAAQKEARAEAVKVRKVQQRNEDKDDLARELILNALPTDANGAISQTSAVTRAKGNGVGDAGLKEALDALVESGEVLSKQGRQTGTSRYWRAS